MPTQTFKTVVLKVWLRSEVHLYNVIRFWHYCSKVLVDFSLKPFLVVGV